MAMPLIVSGPVPALLSVTFWATLAVLITWLGKVSEGGDTPACGTGTPVPLTTTCWPEPVTLLALSVTSIQAPRLPAAAGVKVAEMVHDPFGASEAGQVLAVMVNSLASAPTTVMLAILKTSVPGFDRVVVSAPLVVPIFWLPNEGDRADEQPMQVVSGAIHAPRVHFEAPPSSAMPQEMRGFINWFNRTAPGSGDPLPNLTRAGIAHLYFVSIHPSRTGTAALPGRLPKKRWHKAGVSRRSSLRRRLSSPGARSITRRSNPRTC